MKVVEIFNSIDGEGSRAGFLATFIRLYGCNLSCTYCDSNYACIGNDYKEMTIYEILTEVEKYNCHNITLTGGEPLIHEEDATKLISLLIKNGYEVNIETNGSKDIERIRNSIKHKYNPKVARNQLFFTMDWKSIYSGMATKNLQKNLMELDENDVLKFVVADEKDLEQMTDIITTYLPYLTCHIFVSPVFGKIEPKDIVAYLQKNPCLSNVRLQLQMHKYIWPADMRGV